jgi:hypothetical protein
MLSGGEDPLSRPELTRFAAMSYSYAYFSRLRVLPLDTIYPSGLLYSVIFTGDGVSPLHDSSNEFFARSIELS